MGAIRKLTERLYAEGIPATVHRTNLLPIPKPIFFLPFFITLNIFLLSVQLFEEELHFIS